MNNTATTAGVSGKTPASNTTDQARQQIALAQLLNVLADKIGDMFVANGCDPRLAKKLVDLAPAILKALMNGKKPEQGQQPDMSRPMLSIIQDLMKGKPMAFNPASPEQEDMAEKASKDPVLKDFMDKVKVLMNPDKGN